jgi:threonine dehydratase
MTQWKIPTLRDVLRARKVIQGYLPRTPLYHYSLLSERLGFDVYIKHENHQPIGAFKVRGGINLIAQLPDEERRRGVITASTGNHGQSIAYAARLFGVQAIIGMPEGANPQKVSSIRALGAQVLFYGKDFDEVREHVERLAHERGYRYVHSANEPLLIAGVGTYMLEILEDEPEIDAVIVPVGGGSGASGCCIVAKAVDPAITVIAVQSEQAPAAYLSWKRGQPVEAAMKTFAEGIATRVPFELTQHILREHLDDFVLVSDEELKRAIVLLLETTRNLAEGAGAASLAAALRLKERLQGKKVALVLSGGNLSVEQLREVLQGYASS